MGKDKGSVEELKNIAEKAKKKYQQPVYSVKDAAKDVVGTLIIAGGAFVWCMVMLLILSFVTLSYLHFEIKKMIVWSIIFAVATGVLVAVFKVNRAMKIIHRTK